MGRGSCFGRAGNRHACVCFRGVRLMNLVAISPLLLALALASFPHRAAAQMSDPSESRGPRFLLAMAERAKPVPLDLKRSAVLRQALSLAFEGATLKEALAEISRQARLDLVYADDDLPIDMPVSLRADRITVAAALTDVLLDAGVDIVFTRDGRATLVKRPAGPALQLGSIAGTVTAGEAGTPLVRAVVSVVGTRPTAETDASGRYVISSVPVGTQRLRARMLGYAPADTSVVVAEGEEAVVNLQLKAQAIELEAIVAVGYGTRRSADVTGSVAGVNTENIKTLPVTGVDQALAGQVAGVQISQSNGIPGGGPQIQIRGVGAIGAGTQPLYVVDGFPLSTTSSEISNPLNDIPPGDIESISVLKDASAAAIYGSRGANGVVLITTKSGQGARPRIEV